MFPLFPIAESAAQLRSETVVGRQAVKLGEEPVETLAAQIKAISTDVSVIVDSDVSIDSLVVLLDAGAEFVVVSESAAEELTAAGVAASRIVLNLGSDLVRLGELVTASQEVAGFWSSAQDADELAKLAKTLESQVLPTGGSKFLVSTVAASPAIHTVAWAEATSELISSSLVARLVSDRQDGLFTTLVVDERNTALGLVYSSAESITAAITTGTGVYQSRKRGLWYKGQSSGAVQKLLRVDVDCDGDCVRFVVDQTAPGFCHNNTQTCFGPAEGLAALENTLVSRKASAPEGSYTARLFSDAKLLRAKIMEEAEELCDASSPSEVAWEAADLFYFALTKLVQSGVTLADVERNLNKKSRKVTRRKGDAKRKWIEGEEKKESEEKKPATEATNGSGRIQMNKVSISSLDSEDVAKAITRPAQKTADIMKLVTPIVQGVRTGGDKALLEYTAKFDGVKLDTPVLRAPFPAELMAVSQEVKDAIDLSIANVEKFHAAQVAGTKDVTLRVETSPGVICSRFSRPISSVGLYIPGGTAVLPSTAYMLGVPAKVAGCKTIILASPPRKDGTLTPEVVYVAHKIGASAILLAGGAQAVAAMAYGTESVPKVDKIMGPGNQFVTAAKMFVQNDTTALVSIDMPAGPSEVLVVADRTSTPAFVASDLLSQAEHGVDSQVILIAVDMTAEELAKVEDELHEQALRLPRVDIVRGSIAHSTILEVKTIEEAMDLSNKYAPEHLILQVENASSLLPLVEHAGSVFVGEWSPESCGDYSSGTNHTLPTYGYANMYSGVNTDTFMKHITSQELTVEGLKNIGPAVMALAATEGLDAHRNAVKVRLEGLS